MRSTFSESNFLHKMYITPCKYIPFIFNFIDIPFPPSFVICTTFHVVIPSLNNICSPSYIHFYACIAFFFLSGYFRSGVVVGSFIARFFTRRGVTLKGAEDALGKLGVN